MNPVLLACLVSAALGALGGYWAGDAMTAGELDQLRSTYATEKQTAERRARENLQAAQARGDALTNDLLAAQAQADAYQEQLHAALARQTTGRACLGGGALRLLDGSASGIRADQLPTPAGVPAAADAGDVATDTQVARWAADAYYSYAECARRLDALIQFEEAQ